jgi:D-alanine-D-alanine ligase
MTRKKDIGKIGVLAGGPSSEREISLRSGRAVYKALAEEGFDAVFLDVTAADCRDVIRMSRIDAAFIALHGKFGEDGTVQKMLGDERIPYTGSGVEASRLALDKVASKEVFVKKGIPTPRYTVFKKDDIAAGICDKIALPTVVKPQFEGSSIGLSIVKDRAALKAAAEKALGYDAKAIAEEYIEGRELTVGILNDMPLPAIEIVTQHKVYDYEAKYSDPRTQYLVPAPVDKASYEKAMELGGAVHAALGCRSFSRVDIMMDGKGRLFVLEVNTIPGMTERSLLPKAAAAMGLSFNALCVKLIEDAFLYARV